MFTVKPLPEFSEWLAGLKDRMTRIRLARRLEKVQRGQLGDVKAVGHGVFEMREHFGGSLPILHARLNWLKHLRSKT